MQTDPPPKIMKSSFSIQTETPPEPKPLPVLPRITMERETQTEEVEDKELSRTPSPQLESMASSSSTIVPPTPKPQTKALDHQHSDEPPAYNQITGDRDEQEWRVAAETLKKMSRFPESSETRNRGRSVRSSTKDWPLLIDYDDRQHVTFTQGTKSASQQPFLRHLQRS